MNILNLDPENDRACKYEKVIISTDADPDGCSVGCSLKFWFSSKVVEVVQKLAHFVVLKPSSTLVV